jgi:hypothetical protein
MKHIKDNDLRALLDEVFSADKTRDIQRHLDSCRRCSQRKAILEEQAKFVTTRMTGILPESHIESPSVQLAYKRFEQRYLRKEHDDMKKTIFSRKYLAVWITVGVIAILAVVMLIPSVRVAASSFLGLFRVEQITLVPFNQEKFTRQIGSRSQFENLFSEDVQVEKFGEMQQYTDEGEASQAAGFSLRLPSGLEESPVLVVQPGAKMILTIDLPRIRALLIDIGLENIQLPDDINGTQAVIDLSTAVYAAYGDCGKESVANRQPGSDPDDPSTWLPHCNSFIQMPSPTVTAPPGLDLASLGQAFLQITGMDAIEAARFSQTIDWTTTLVIPIPRDGLSYQEVIVDGTKGWYIRESDNDGNTYMLMWIKDGMVYVLDGSGDLSSALSLTESLQ